MNMEKPPAKIFAPDTSLLNKLGTRNLEQAFSPQALQEAEKVISQSADHFIHDSLRQIATLEKALEILEKSGPETSEPFLRTIIDGAFSIKTQVAVGGYLLVAALARSMQLFAEQLLTSGMAEKDVVALKWHAVTMKRLLVTKTKDDGGEIGVAIKAELEKLLRKS